jgi:hypothetical protein
MFERGGLFRITEILVFFFLLLLNICRLFAIGGVEFPDTSVIVYLYIQVTHTGQVAQLVRAVTESKIVLNLWG